MKRPRLRKWAKWACTVAALAAVSAGLLSRRYFCQHGPRSNSGGAVWQVYLGHGTLLAYHNCDSRTALSSFAPGWRMGRSGGWGWPGSREAMSFFTEGDGWAGVFYAAGRDDWAIEVSLLWPMALTALPAALLWCADRRRFGPHQCKKCGYDRRGLAVGVKCPECGAVPTGGPVG